VVVPGGHLAFGAELRQGTVVVEGKRVLARRFETLFEFDESESFAGRTRQEAEVGIERLVGGG
jgi:hypothetical protein